VRSTPIAIFVALIVQPMTNLLQLFGKIANRRKWEAEARWSQLATPITVFDLHTVIASCVIGLLLAVNLALRFPELGAVIEQFNQF